jgi:hypothetical protein
MFAAATLLFPVLVDDGDVLEPPQFVRAKTAAIKMGSLFIRGSPNLHRPERTIWLKESLL